MGRFSRQFEPVYRRIRDDIFALCDMLNFEPTWQQKLILQAVMDGTHGKGPSRVACKSGQGPGKTTASVVASLWRSLQGVDGLTVVTAPTMRQCKDVFLVEFRRRMEVADPLLKRLVTITKSKVVIGNRPDWGVKLVTATKPENAQGYHQENLTFIAEEASGIPRVMIEQIQGTLTNERALFMQIGNPNTRDCAFFDCFHSKRDRWATFTLNAEESPIVSKAHIEELEEEYGRDHDVFRVRVLGEFPHSDPRCVISSEDLEACCKTDPYTMALLPNLMTGQPSKHIGIDFARFGSDESVIYRRSGNSVVEWKAFAHTEPGHVAYAAFRMQAEAGWYNSGCTYVPDAGGMGQGVLHLFYDASKSVFEFHNGGTAYDSRQYRDKITEGWFHLGKLARKHEIFIPNDNRLIHQLSTRQYATNRKGQLVIESKEDYEKRGFDSPDRADALVMAFYDYASGTARITSRPPSRAVGARVMT